MVTVPTALALGEGLTQPQATLIAAAVTAAAVVLGLLVQSGLAVRAITTSRDAIGQKDASDRVEAQWSRIEWSVELVLGDNSYGIEIGMDALLVMSVDPTLSNLDLRVVESALDAGDAKITELIEESARRQGQSTDDSRGGAVGHDGAGGR